MDGSPSQHSSGIIRKLTNKYRLVILDDETFEERLSFQLSRFNVLVLLSVLAIAFAFLMYALFIFTPLKEYIPGYGDPNLRKSLIKMKIQVDSIDNYLSQQELWMQNIRNVLEGNLDSMALVKSSKVEFFDTIKLDKIPIEDVLLREAIEREEGYALIFSEQESKKKGVLFDMNFFDVEKEHFGIDIVAQEKAPVVATLDGTVFFAGWTMETGYVIGIQHSNNIVSFYKHNSVILKKIGNFVKAGEPIAIIGNSGELTSGPHLHFELWKDGIPVNPEDYLIF
jgi:murein DD-endopeptidase MepM/ murein hydrolase activator NlpD